MDVRSRGDPRRFQRAPRWRGLFEKWRNVSCTSMHFNTLYCARLFLQHELIQQEPIDTAKPSSDLRQQCGTLGCKPVAWNVSSSYSLSSAARTASQHGVFTPNFVIASVGFASAGGGG